MDCPACDHVNIDGARFCAKCGAPMPVAAVAGADPMIGSTVGGRYRVTALLGEGGMGRVYTAEQQMGTAVRRVAVKTLLQEFSRDGQVVARFMRECGTVVELEHANTIKFFDFGKTDQGDLYIAMEFVDGKPLADIIVKEGAMSPERVDHIMKQICGSLNEAHEKGIVHRDLKPENVVLTEKAGESDFVKVLDFGIAKRKESADTAREQKLTQQGMVLGTPPYMSPEQFTGAAIDRRSDIYSLGVMAYEMLTGRLPFNANTPWEWATQHMTVQPSPFEKVVTGAMAARIPTPMKDAILRALAKKPEDRQATAKEFYRELNAAAIASGARVNPVDPAAESAHARPGATQIGEPFLPPDAGMPGPGIPGTGMPGTGMPGAGMPGAGGHAYVPSVGGQAMPAPMPMAATRGGGGKGMMVGAALAVTGVVVAGAWWSQRGGGETDEVPTIPVANSGTPAAEATTTTGGATEATTTTGADGSASDSTTSSTTGGDAGDAGTAATDTASDTPPPSSGSGDTAPPPSSGSGGKTPPPSSGSGGKTPPPPTTPPAGGCGEAIAAAMARNCSAARAAMAKCSGPQAGTAAANLRVHCNGPTFPRPGKKTK